MSVEEGFRHDLAESETRFRALFDNSPDAIFIQDMQGFILEANPAAVVMYGIDREDFNGGNIVDYIEVEDTPEGIRQLAGLKAGETKRLEKQFRGPKGDLIYAEIYSQKIAYKSKPSVLLQIRDNSQNKKFESALRETAEEVSESTGFSFFYGLVLKLSELLKVDFVSIGAFNQKQSRSIETIAMCHQDKILDNMTYELKGTPCENVVGQKLCYFPEKIQELFPEDKMLKDINAVCYLGIPLTRPEGDPLGLLSIVHSQPLKDPELAINLLQIYAHRATAELGRMHAAEELWESEEKYRSLTNDVLDSSAVGIFILDEKFNVVWANQAVGLFFGFERETTIGQDYRILIKEKMNPVFDPSDHFSEEVLSSYQSKTHIEHRECKTASQEIAKERWLEYWSQPIRSGLYAGGRIEHFADITKQKKLQTQLLQAQKMESIGRLAGGIAHDFNNLLTSILGFSYLIKDDLDEDHPAQISIDEVIQAGQRAENLTRQLLVFSRKQVTQNRPIDLNKIVIDMDKLLRRTIGENITLNLDLQKKNLSLVNADPGQLEQVVMNLCINSRDAMPDGGSITVKTAGLHFNAEACKEHLDAQPGDYVMLSTLDTGCGMTKDVCDHACEPFFSTKDKGKGTGLGLAIVYGIIQQAKGFIDIQSEPGRGTNMLIYLPTCSGDPIPAEKKIKDHIPTGTETVLVVEDEESVRFLTVKILETLGYNVLFARNGLEGISVFEEHADKIELIVTDVIMPQMGGPEMIQQLHPTHPDLKYIFTSGFTEDALSKHGLDESSHNLIQKPYARKTLAQTVREVLDRE